MTRTGFCDTFWRGRWCPGWLRTHEIPIVIGISHSNLQRLGPVDLSCSKPWYSGILSLEKANKVSCHVIYQFDSSIKDSTIKAADESSFQENFAPDLYMQLSDCQGHCSCYTNHAGLSLIQSRRISQTRLDDGRALSYPYMYICDTWF